MCSGDDELVNSMVHGDRKTLRTWLIWTITISSSVLISLKSPSHRWLQSEKSKPELHLEGLRGFNDFSIPFCPFLRRKPKAILLGDCSFATSSMTILIYLARYSCERAGMFRAGPGIAPRTKTLGHRPYSHGVKLTVDTAMFRHFLCLLWR